MWSLEAPGNLVLFMVLPVLIYLIHFRKKRGGKLSFGFKNWQDQEFAYRLSPIKAVLVLSRLLFWIGLCALIFASAGPARMEKQQIFLSPGIDIMIVLDESPSMSAQDFKPVNRFEVARDVIRSFIQSRENDQIGLASFAREAALRVPPTGDYDALIESLNSLRIMELGDGTAIGMGIAIGSVHLRSSTANEKIIILLTDGDNNSGEIIPETAAEIAVELGIKIYTVGLGKEGDTYLEFEDPHTQKTYKGFYRGRFNENLLKRIASISNGRYFYAGNPGTLRAVFNEIDVIEKREIKSRWEVVQNARFDIFVLVGFSLILCDFLIRKGVLRDIF